MPFVYRYDPAKPRPRYTLAEMIACVEREILTRKRVYPGFVDTNRYSTLKADREIATMIQVVQELRKMADAERLI